MTPKGEIKITNKRKQNKNDNNEYANLIFI